MRKIAAIIGARPQFIKHAPIEIACLNRLSLLTIHTGQHYDYQMSEVFFKELGMEKPHFQLETGSHGHGAQTGRMMMDLEPILTQEKPDAVLVYGDTNSTLAGALVASKLEIPIVHVEAGLRSFNRSMPEEINRVLTDHLSSLLLVPTQEAIQNLAKEGITTGVKLVGDVMCDMTRIMQQRGLVATNQDFGSYYFATIHRPYNTDDIDRLCSIIQTMNTLDLPVRFALHPRTRARLAQAGIDLSTFARVQFLEPASYIDSLCLQHNAQAVITDSGGVQKEAYLLQRKCVTLRSETEWVETLEGGWNTLVFNNLAQLPIALATPTGAYNSLAYGDGKAANCIVDHILDLF